LFHRCKAIVTETLQKEPCAKREKEYQGTERELTAVDETCTLCGTGGRMQNSDTQGSALHDASVISLLGGMNLWGGRMFSRYKNIYGPDVNRRQVNVTCLRLKSRGGETDGLVEFRG